MRAIWISRIDELLAEKNRVERRLPGQKYTVEDVADYCGVSRQSVQTWKSVQGMQLIAAEYTAKLCRFFNCTYADLWQLVILDEKPDGTEGPVAAYAMN